MNSNDPLIVGRVIPSQGLGFAADLSQEVLQLAADLSFDFDKKRETPAALIECKCEHCAARDAQAVTDPVVLRDVIAGMRKYGFAPPGYQLVKEAEPKLEPHQERMLLESAELREKVDKLDIFMSSDQFMFKLSAAERYLILQQAQGMIAYQDALSARISLFRDK